MSVLAVLALYVVFLGIGIAGARKVSQGEWKDLLVAGRAMPLWLAVLTMTATWVDGGYLLGTVEGTFKAGLPLGAQGGVCFGVSLILGGVFFARRMRRFEFTTLIDPFEARFGRQWAVVLAVPALLGEVFWSAELLVAIGSTFGVMLGVPLAWAISISALVVIVYTVLGGMWSVAYTDAFQLGLVALGLFVALPVVFAAAGGLSSVWGTYQAARPSGISIFPPATPGTWGWTAPSIVNWWDVTAMLVFGGIPWNCYFQRVLSCRTPAKAQWHSILAGLLTIGFTVPPLLLGVAAFAYKWPAAQLAQLTAQPAETLPMVFQYLVPGWVALLGLGAIIGAVTSSFSASILSAGSMFAWNGVYRLWRPDLSAERLTRVIRVVIVALGAGATVLALEVQSVQALWFFTSDLGVRAVVSPAGVRAVRPPREPRRLGRGVRGVPGAAARRGGAAVRDPALDSVSAPVRGAASRHAGELVRRGWSAVVSLQVARRCRRVRDAADRFAADRASRPTARAAERPRRISSRGGGASGLGPQALGGEASPMSQLLAWIAHVYTALGLVCAAAIFALIVRGGDDAFRLAFALMVVATAIDATDGWLARRARVGEVLPGFSGSKLDDLVDFLTYTCLPLALVWRAGLLSPALQPWLLVPLVASAYGFCQVNAKTEDHYFLGFPSYWNIVAFYVYLLGMPERWTLALVLTLAFLTFVPSRYLYPSRAGRWSLLTNVLGCLWLFALLGILWAWTATPRWLVIASLAFPAYYMVLSWAISVRRWRSGNQPPSR